VNEFPTVVSQPRQRTVAVAGASGRLGTLICAVIEEDPGFDLIARLGRASGIEEGAEAEILVDVTHPESSPEIVARAITRGQQVIVGTSGWSAENLTDLNFQLTQMPGSSVTVVPNFSLGSALATVLARIAAPYFDSVEIVEAHHPLKVDSPSGTAVRTAELVSAARASTPVDAPASWPLARGVRVAGIPVHSLRLAGVLAKQEVHFGGVGETLTLSHDTLSDAAYRPGIRAALAAAGTQSGLTVGLDKIFGFERYFGGGQ
jgi:4-hydroxy-tetrahydrodipicolinate reductase